MQQGTCRDVGIRKQFHLDICTNPNDVTPRLIYADWLEDQDNHADAARAEYIRLGIKQYSMDMDANPIQCNCGGHVPLFTDETTIKDPNCPLSLYMAESDRMGELLNTEYPLSINVPGGRRTRTGYNLWAGELWTCLVASMKSNPHFPYTLTGSSWGYMRGMVEYLQASLGHWISYSQCIVVDQPITYLRVTDRQPRLTAGDRAEWYRFRSEGDYIAPLTNRHVLPHVIFDYMQIDPTTVNGRDYVKVYRSSCAAYMALSLALINLAREDAHLPILTNNLIDARECIDDNSECGGR